MKGEFKAVLWARILALLLLPLPLFLFYFALFGSFNNSDGFTAFIRFGMFPLLGLGFLSIVLSIHRKEL